MIEAPRFALVDRHYANQDELWWSEVGELLKQPIHEAHYAEVVLKDFGLIWRAPCMLRDAMGKPCSYEAIVIPDV